MTRRHNSNEYLKLIHVTFYRGPDSLFRSGIINDILKQPFRKRATVKARVTRTTVRRLHSKRFRGVF